MIETTWRHVRPGAVVVVNGARWEVTARTARTVTMTNDGGERTGAPNMDATVHALESWTGQTPADWEMASVTVTELLGGIEIDVS